MSSKASKKKISLVDNTILFSLISIVLGLLVGAIALLIAGKDPIQAYSAMIEGVFGKQYNLPVSRCLQAKFHLLLQPP